MLHARGLTPPHRRSRALATAVAVAVTAVSQLAAAQATIAGPNEDPAGVAVLHGGGLEYFSHNQLFRILGKDVVSATGEKMGRVVDVLFDPAGKPLAAVIDFGGFLGVGTRKIAVEWDALRFDLGEKKEIIILDLGREQLQAAPEYRESDKSIAVVSLPQLGTSRTPAASN